MTPDRESVIKRLEKVSYYFKSLLTVGWQGDADIYREHKESVNMAIALLKEQQETISSFQGTIHKLNAALEEQAEIVRCGECIYHHYTNDRIPYCELIDYGYGWKDNDFCSRGKKAIWDDKG